ncbi:MAG: Signal transduction histidine kinase [Akkermansiaceae bacterium]|nr:Signal transduction histidine kinase [Akkermansiaceae bacterium]
MPAPGILDEEQLTMCMSGDEAEDRDLITLGLEETVTLMLKMGAAFETGDDDIWRRAAHRGKGSCATLGMKELAAIFADAERDDGSAAVRKGILVSLPPALERTRAAMRELLSSALVP